MRRNASLPLPRTLLLLFILALLLPPAAHSFLPYMPCFQTAIQSGLPQLTRCKLCAETDRKASSKGGEFQGYVKPGLLEFPEDISDEWELDCYSRPVLGEDGRKLWELLIADSASDFRYIKTIPSNIVNSRNLRKAVEEVIEASPVRPKSIRFFRSQMFNMISIALSTLDIDVKPSRRTHNLFMWLQEREKHVYPSMSGFNPQLKQQTILDFDVSQPDRLPDTIKSESYAFTALPAEVFFDGQVNLENIKRGRLCPLRELPKSKSSEETRWVHGITLFSRRADAVAAWMSGLDIAFLKSDLIARELLLNTDISSQFIVAPLMDAQKREAQIFEKGKVNIVTINYFIVFHFDKTTCFYPVKLLDGSKWLSLHLRAVHS